MPDSRSRSRSPRRSTGHRASRHDAAKRDSRRRSRSPEPKGRRTSPEGRLRSPSGKDSSKRHRSSRHHRERPSQAGVALPFSARPLSKADLSVLEPLFAHYLSLQKQIEWEDLNEREIKGRWKSFVGKWNRGELAEGWYDPEMFARIAAEAPERRRRTPLPEPQGSTGIPSEQANQSDDDEYGPSLAPTAPGRRAGAGFPTIQDLAVRDELAQEDREADREALRDARKADRVVQKERLDDIAPRAEAGTRERMLEKRQLVNDKMREFREKSPGMDAGDEKELMGGGDSVAELKRLKEHEQRRKTERELRREEIERAKREEVEERRRAWKQREEGTVSMLRELAKQRFG